MAEEKAFVALRIVTGIHFSRARSLQAAERNGGGHVFVRRPRIADLGWLSGDGYPSPRRSGLILE